MRPSTASSMRMGEVMVLLIRAWRSLQVSVSSDAQSHHPSM